MELVFNPSLSHEETQLRNDWLFLNALGMLNPT